MASATVEKRIDKLTISATARRDRSTKLLKVLGDDDARLEERWKAAEDRTEKVKEAQEKLAQFRKFIAFQDVKTKRLKDFLSKLTAASADLNKDFVSLGKVRMPADDQQFYQVYRSRLRDIFKKKAPKELRNLDKYLGDWKGDEHAIYLKMCKKYGAKPEPKFTFERKIKIPAVLPLGPCRFNVTKKVLRLVKSADPDDENVEEHIQQIMDLLVSATPDQDWASMLTEVLYNVSKVQCNVINVIRAAMEGFNIEPDEMGVFLATSRQGNPSCLRFAVEADVIETYDETLKEWLGLNQAATEQDPEVKKFLADNIL